MTRSISAALAGAIMLVAGAAHAQEFRPGYDDIGPTLGLGSVGSASAAFGVRFEHGIKRLPSLGNGTLGFEVSADFYSWRGNGYRWRYTPLGATANYHFNLENTHFDPFIGLGLGYEIIGCDYPGIGINACRNSYLYVIGRAGARYFFTPSTALYGDVGAGGATLNLGVTFRLK
jgi:hypothetical protein